jgi:pentatricopeptide repeat protein
MEATLLVFFCLGFVMFNSTAVQALTQRGGKAKLLRKQLEADYASGNYEVLLESAKEAKCWDVATVVLAVQALLELKRFGEIVSLLQSAPVVFTLEGLHAVLPLVASAPPEAATAVRKLFEERGVKPNEKTTEILVLAYTGEEDFESLKKLRDQGVPLPARSYTKWAKDELKKGNLQGAAQRMGEMKDAGFYIPTQLIAQLARAGARAGRVAETLALLTPLQLGGEAIAAVVEQAQKDNHIELLEGTLALATEELSYAAYDHAIRAYTRRSDPRAFRYWDAMLAAGHVPTDGTATQVIILCGEGRNIPLAEHILATTRKAGRASLVMYSAVARVYAAARLFHKSCDLANLLAEDNLEPDNIMYGSLIKAAVECGRLDLSRELLRKSGTLDIQNYMSLFRACGREKNVTKVLELLAELENSAIPVDTTAYNCVLDVCVKSGDSRAVRTLFAKMKSSGFVDVISYNTLVKDMQASGTVADEVLDEMKSMGLRPNQITYNSLINAAVSRGESSQAWKYVTYMKMDGIPMDNFTCSIMMKGLKHSSNREDVDNTLKLIEQSQVGPDEVLINTLLDACIRLRDVGRLTKSLEAFRAQGAVPSEHAYQTVIRAYGHARALQQAEATWAEMLEKKVRPTEGTFAAMVDACVSNGAVEQAIQVFHDMKAQIPDYSTPVGIYHTLIKVLAQRKLQKQAMEIYSDMRESKLQPNVATYNSLIDLCARSGDVDQSAQIFRDMCMSGVTPDLITYSTVIKGYCVKGELEQAITLFTLMRKRGIAPDAVLFNSILDGAARKQMTSLVEQVFEDMVSSAVPPSSFTLSILIRLYGKNQDIETALSYFETLPMKFGFEPNDQVYACLIGAFVSSGRMPQAYEHFASMANPDAKAYASIINGALKHSDVAGAIRLLTKALGAGVALEQDLVSNVVFMADRRNLGNLLAPLTPKLQAAGYQTSRAREETSPVEGSSRFHARRKQSQSWRDVAA